MNIKAFTKIGVENIFSLSVALFSFLIPLYQTSDGGVARVFCIASLFVLVMRWGIFAFPSILVSIGLFALFGEVLNFWELVFSILIPYSSVLIVIFYKDHAVIPVKSLIICYIEIYGIVFISRFIGTLILYKKFFKSINLQKVFFMNFNYLAIEFIISLSVILVIYYINANMYRYKK